MTPGPHGLPECAARNRTTFRETGFNDLLRKHANAAPAERALIEPILFSRLVDFRRDVKRGRITAKDKGVTDALLAKYKPTTEHVRQKRKK
jgi:hypothetical protein